MSLASEVRRYLSARITHSIAKRRGHELGMWIGCGYPRSGTVWLCNLMATYLEVPYPQNYEFPIAMKSVIHSHDRWEPGLPPTIYIYRDGRDVLTSLFFYLTHSGLPDRNPLSRAVNWFRRPRLDRDLARRDPPAQFARLLESEIRDPIGDLDWASHVRDWLGRPGTAAVSYEDLRSDPVSTLGGAFAELGVEVNNSLLRSAAGAHDFAERTGRRPGEAAPDEFKRSGVSGEWRKYFTRETAELFRDYAGELLVTLGYEEDMRWPSRLEGPSG